MRGKIRKFIRIVTSFFFFFFLKTSNHLSLFRLLIIHLKRKAKVTFGERSSKIERDKRWIGTLKTPRDHNYFWFTLLITLYSIHTFHLFTYLFSHSVWNEIILCKIYLDLYFTWNNYSIHIGIIFEWFKFYCISYLFHLRLTCYR